MSKHSRLADHFGTDEVPRMSRRRRRRILVTQDGTAIVMGESYPIAGLPLALDARPAPSLAGITFDGAMPTDEPSPSARRRP